MCRHVLRTGVRRRSVSSRWSFRRGVKILLIAVALTSFILSIFTVSYHPWVIPLDSGHSSASGPVVSRRTTPEDDHVTRISITASRSNDRVINPHDFNYIILETDVCVKNPKPFLLAVVHTHPAHYKRRTVIRETWGGVETYNSAFQNGVNLKLIVLFMMGSTADSPGLMAAVKAESERYKDIIQEDFEDTYRNLTHKAVMWLKWTSTYCPSASYLLKVDDDIFVNTFNLINHLRHLYMHRVAAKRSILCLVWYRMQVIRNPRSKWYVTREEYPEDHFSRYCSGSAYILTGDLLKPLYSKALATKFFWVDDFYVTGLLPRSLQVYYHNIASLYSLRQAEVRDKLVHNNAIFGHVPGSLILRYSLWKEILNARGLRSINQNLTI